MRTRLAALSLALGLCWSVDAFAGYDDEGYDTETHEDDAYDDEGALQRPSARPATEREEEESGSLEAGGIAAPDGTVEQDHPSTDVEARLDESDRRDSGRGLEFLWLNGELGFAHVNLTGLSNDGLVPGGLSGSGLAFGGALGIRLLYFTFGTRFRMERIDPFRVWSLTGEFGIRVPIVNLEPHLELGIGYAGALDVPYAGLEGGAEAPGIGGVDLRAQLGADYYVSDYVSFGAQLGSDFLFLKRSAASAGSGLDEGDPLLSEGSGTGTTFFATAVFGVHF